MTADRRAITLPGRSLVAGASGFLGTALCRRLAAAHVEVCGLSRREPRAVPGVEWRKCDVTDADQVARVVDEIAPDVIFNAAGLSDARPALDRVLPTFAGNAGVSVNLLASAARVGSRFVQCGSLQEADAGGPGPSSPYAMAKSVETAYARFFHRSFDLATVVLRFGIVYGPGEENRQRLIPHVISTLLRGESPRLSSGTQTADWLFIDDATAALMAAAVATTAPGRVLNVGAGRSTSVRELVDRLAGLIANGVTPQFGALPDRPMAPTRDAEPAEVFNVLGWSPSTELPEGLRETVAYYRANS